MAATVWRIAAETRTYGANDLSGTGSSLDPGRWNKEGQKVVYAAQTISLAVLETVAHVDTNGLPQNRFLVAISIPAAAWRKRQQLSPADLPPQWSALPAGQASIEIGDKWYVAGTTAILEVPSVIVPEERIVVINPEHGDVRGKLKANVIRAIDYHLALR